MTIPSNINADITALQTMYNAALPIESADPLVFAAIDNKAWLVVSELDGQVASVGAMLDAWAPGNAPLNMASALTNITQSANDELDAYEARSYMGRFAANLDLVEGYGKYFAMSQPLKIYTSVHAVLNFMNPAASAYVGAIF